MTVNSQRNRAETQRSKNKIYDSNNKEETMTMETIKEKIQILSSTLMYKLTKLETKGEIGRHMYLANEADFDDRAE